MNEQFNDIPVDAFKETGEYIGSYSSFTKAANSLYITTHCGKKIGEHIKSVRKNPVVNRFGEAYTFKIKSEKNGNN